jgi:hypothetical protein
MKFIRTILVVAAVLSVVVVGCGRNQGIYGLTDAAEERNSLLQEQNMRLHELTMSLLDSAERIYFICDGVLGFQKTIMAGLIAQATRAAEVYADSNELWKQQRVLNTQTMNSWAHISQIYGNQLRFNTELQSVTVATSRLGLLSNQQMKLNKLLVDAVGLEGVEITTGGVVQ